jgi:aspartate/methionine/tyrosine aminotransferase
VRDEFALGAFLARWHGAVRHDLSASVSETMRLTDLLAMAEPADIERWQGLGLGYAEPHGAPWLRATIAARHQGMTADDVSCCAGAQESLTCLMRALLTPDDHAIVVLPVYQPSERAVTAICAATGVALTERDSGWQLDLDRITAALRPETRLILMNFPNSPTGAPIDAATLDALIDLCRKRGIWLVNDEVYRLSGEGVTLPPLADLYERGISIDALSKAFGMPGLRIGWVVCRDRAALARLLTAKSGLSSCPAVTSEVLAHIALRGEGPILARNRAIARANLARLRMVFRRHPDVFEDVDSATVFAFPRYRGGGSAERYAAVLVREAGVLVLPSTLWASPLARVPRDRLRLGFGRQDASVGVAALAMSLAEQGEALRVM